MRFVPPQGMPWPPFLTLTETGDHIGVSVNIIETYAKVRDFTWEQIDYRFDINLRTRQKERMWWGIYTVSEEKKCM